MIHIYDIYREKNVNKTKINKKKKYRKKESTQ